jgi:hypothetical protein
MYLEKLRHRLRVHRLLLRTQQSIREASGRVEERYLQRVQIAVRAPGGQLQAVQDEVVRVLSAAGAEVVCDVTILAHGERGVRESAVDEVVRRWQELGHGRAEVRKEVTNLADARAAGAIGNAEVSV